MSRACLIAASLMMLALVSCAPRTQPSAVDSTPTPTTTPDSTPMIPPSERVPRITTDELLQKIKSQANILIVDSRIDVENLFAAGHIYGAIPVPLSKITEGQWLPPADQNQEIIFYCTWPDEKTSARAALELINKGFTNVEVLKGGYNAWKDAGHPISYQKNGITFIQGASLFDLVDPIKPELGQELTIEGYYGGGDLFMFIGITNDNQVLFNHINLKGVNHRGLGRIVRLQGKIIEVRDGIGDMNINTVEILPGDIRAMIDTVDAHWKDLRDELLKETNSSHPDGAVGSPLFDQRTHEVILYRNVGNMITVSSPTQFAGELGYVPEVNVYYFLNLDGKITKIFLQYRQLK